MTIESFLHRVEEADGLELSRVEPLTTLTVWTRNSLYRLVVVAGCDVVLQGGPFYPELTPAYVEGARAGGSLLKMGWIAVGLSMEFRVGGKLFATSPIVAITAEEPDDVPVN